jgi:hypothetical protein
MGRTRSGRAAGSLVLLSVLVTSGAGAWEEDGSLSEASGSFVGEESEDHAGTALAAAGDVDGDGLDDLLVGAAGNDEAGTDAGQVYLLFGQPSGWVTDVHLSLADASFHGEAAGDRGGRSVAGIGDVDGDGLDDLLIGAPPWTPGSTRRPGP